MKRTCFLIATAIILLVSFNSCGNSNLDLDKTLKFSTQSVEQQKQTVEQNGIDFVNKMEGMKDTKAMVALNAFSTNLNGSPAFVKPMNQLRDNIMKNNVNSLETFNGQMKVMAAENDVWGTYTWNPSKEDFDFVASTTKGITALFPATEGSTSNTGELKINYSESNVAAPDTDPVQYMPSSISLVLKVSGTVAMKADFSGSYNLDATPKKVTQTLEIEKYNWKLEFTNDDKDASFKYAFNYNTDVLVKFEAAAGGTLTATAIQNSINSENGGPQDIFTSGAIYFQVMNIAFLGGFKDFKAFYNEMNSYKNTNDRAYADKQVSSINKYLKLYGYYVDKNQKFADVEFYVVESTSTDIDYYVYPYQTITTTSYDYQPRFVMSDGSKVDIQTYMESGFEDLITKLENF